MASQRAMLIRKMPRVFLRVRKARAFKIWQLQRRILDALAMTVPISRARHADVLREHRELITAFRENDKGGALACVGQHIRGAGENQPQLADVQFTAEVVIAY